MPMTNGGERQKTIVSRTPSPPSILDSAEVLQKQVFLEPPDNCGIAPQCSTLSPFSTTSERAFRRESSALRMTAKSGRSPRQRADPWPQDKREELVS
jgi:hypothetical protein